MGYYATIILVGAFFIGGITIFAMKADTRDADLGLADHQLKVLAREAAHTGLQMTVRELADSYNMLSWNYGTNNSLFSGVSYKTGSYSVTVTTTNPSGAGALGDTVDVVSRGRNGDSRHAIFARYARDKDDKGIPPAFENAISSDQFMHFAGHFLVASIDGTRNASTHTNTDLRTNGNAFSVEGFGTYSGTEDVKGGGLDNFTPPNDYNGDEDNVHWSPIIEIPVIDSLGLKNMAQTGQGLFVNTGGAEFVIDGAITPTLDFTQPATLPWNGQDGAPLYSCTASGGCGTPENPAVIYVDGNVRLQNRVQVKGHAIFMSTGTTYVSPNGHGGGFFGELTDDKKTEVLLASLTDIDIGQGGGNACLGLGPPTVGNMGKTNNHCQSAGNGAAGYTHGVTVYALGEVMMRGTPLVVGGVVADEASMDNGGNPSIIYASAHEGTIDGGFEWIVPIGPILIAFSEF